LALVRIEDHHRLALTALYKLHNSAQLRVVYVVDIALIVVHSAVGHLQELVL